MVFYIEKVVTRSIEDVCFLLRYHSFLKSAMTQLVVATLLEIDSTENSKGWILVALNFSIFFRLLA